MSLINRTRYKHRVIRVPPGMRARIIHVLRTHWRRISARSHAPCCAEQRVALNRRTRERAVLFVFTLFCCKLVYACTHIKSDYQHYSRVLHAYTYRYISHARQTRNIWARAARTHTHTRCERNYYIIIGGMAGGRDIGAWATLLIHIVYGVSVCASGYNLADSGNSIGRSRHSHALRMPETRRPRRRRRQQRRQRWRSLR